MFKTVKLGDLFLIFEEPVFLDLSSLCQAQLCNSTSFTRKIKELSRPPEGLY